MGDFIHLHVHTEYSLLDGAARIKSLVKKCKEYGMDSCAITDHGNMFGAVNFYDACKDAGIKAIIGCEFYVADDLHQKSGRQKNAHLILLAKNEKGYLNISKLNTIAFNEGMYYKPRIDYKTLESHAEGVVCLSACLAGDIPQYIMNGMMDEAEKLTKWFKDLFGEDFYLELQNHHLEEDIVVNAGLKELAKKFNIKTVATNDVHYINKDDSKAQDILLCVQTGKTFDDPDRMRFPNEEFYLKNYDEMAELFPNDLDALATTREIADKCNYDFVYGHYLFPKYNLPEGKDALTYLRELIDKGLKEKFPEITDQIRDRVESELSVITKQGFTEYFLTVWDYINAARKMGIPVGPGRGSGAGSIVAYAIGITDINPLKYDLLFERFLHTERVTAPDFDIDFADDRRAKVIDYVRQEYGEKRVVKIITFGTMAAKNAIKDVGRVLRVPYSSLDKVTKAIPSTVKRPNIIEKVFGLNRRPDDPDETVPELIEMYNENDEIRRVVDTAAKLEDMPRQTGTHACGVIIGNDELEKFVPLARNGDDITTQYEGPVMEHLGLLKFDFLGLRNLTDIEKSIQYIKENHGVDVNFKKCNYDDPKVFQLISTGNTKAIFQLESGGFQKFMKDLRPTCLEDIVAGVSLYRPGPMDSIPRYVHNKHNPEDIKYDHPILEHILDVTYGCIVYQEQVMRIVQDMAGYTLGQADMVRRMMAKKKKSAMAAERQVFIYGKPAENGKPAIVGAKSKGVSEEVANKIWDEMESFASYAFNKSHAAAYSFVTYQTAYLKCYYEPEFLTAVLNNRITNADEIKNYATYAREEGIEVLPPDVNKSYTMFTVKDDKIRFGLAALKNVGVAVVDTIIDERKRGGDYKSIEDFINRLDGGAVNKRCIESLILSGAFDCFGKKRSQLMRVYNAIVEKVAEDKKTKATGQLSFFDLDLKQDVVNEIEYPNIDEFDDMTRLKLEKEVVGLYVTGNPLDKYKDRFKNYSLTSDMLVVDQEDGDELSNNNDSSDDNKWAEMGLTDGMEVTCGGIITEVKKLLTKKNNQEMAFGTIEDLYGSIELMFFPKVYGRVKEDLALDKLVTVKGKLSIRDGEAPTVLVDILQVWDQETNIEGGHAVKPKTLFLKYDLTDLYLHENIKKILKCYEGNIPVIVRNTHDNNPYQLGFKVQDSVSMVKQLYAYLDENSVKLI